MLVTRLDAIPPFLVRFFPNTEGIRVGSTVRIVRDPERKEFEVISIVLPKEFSPFHEHIRDSKSLGALLGHYSVERVISLMRNRQWLYKIAVEIRRYSDKRCRVVEYSRRIHPACLCLANRK